MSPIAFKTKTRRRKNIADKNYRILEQGIVIAGINDYAEYQNEKRSRKKDQK